MISSTRPSIARRLTRLIGYSALVAALMVPIVGIAHQYSISSRTIRQSASTVRESSLPVLSYLLWTVNQTQVEQMLQGILTDPTLAAATIEADGIETINVAEAGFVPARSERSRYTISYNDGTTSHTVGTLTIWNKTPLQVALSNSPIIGEVVVGLLLVAVVITLFTLMVQRDVTTPLLTLIRHVDALGEEPDLPAWWDEELARDPGRETHRVRLALEAALRRNHEEIAHRRATERELATSLEEKEVLLQEIHHRVKNNLQLVMSFLSLQRASITDTTALQALEDSQNRVTSMAIIHEMLYRGDRSDSVMIDEYLASLAQGLHPVDSPELTISVDAESVAVTIDAAVPCGLIVTELLTNAIKHAFGSGRRGEIAITARRGHDDECLMVAVADNGCGLPEGWSVESEETLGTRIIGALTQQLGATLSVESGAGGTRFSLSVPLHAGDAGCRDLLPTKPLYQR